MRLDPEPNRKKTKQRYASSATGRPSVKSKAKTSPGKIFIDFIFSGKNFPGSLAFFPRLHVERAFFFSGFFFVEMVLIKLYTMA
mgnify:FL=1